MRRFIHLLGFFLVTPFALADQAIYCAQHNAYVSLGMTQAQVRSACGEPTQKEKGTQPYEQKIPVLQLIYNGQGGAKAFYGVWTLPTGLNQGSTLAVTIVDNKIKSVSLDGGSDRAVSICNGAALEVGDPVSKVYSVCGNPSIINNTYTVEATAGNSLPDVWTYASDYQPTLKLIFVDDHLIAAQ